MFIIGPTPGRSRGFAPRSIFGARSATAQGAVDVATGVLRFEGLALVVELAAPGDAELDLGDAVSEVELQGHERQALLGGLGQEPVDLAAVEQELAGTLGLVVHPVGLEVL